MFWSTQVDILDLVVETIYIFSIPSIVVDSVDTWLIVDQFLAKLPVLLGQWQNRVQHIQHQVQKMLCLPFNAV